MAVILDNQDYPVITEEQICQSKELLKSNIQKLKIYKKPFIKKSIALYGGFTGTALLSGIELSRCINNVNENDLIIFLATAPLVFATNYYGIQSLKLSFIYNSVIRKAKRALKLHEKVERLSNTINKPVSELTKLKFIAAAQVVDDFVQDEQKVLTLNNRND